MVDSSVDSSEALAQVLELWLAQKLQATRKSSKSSSILPALNKSWVFRPAEINAKPGDIAQFQFSQINHTVAQSSLGEPCQPILQGDVSAAGVH